VASFSQNIKYALLQSKYLKCCGFLLWFYPWFGFKGKFALEIIKKLVNNLKTLNLIEAFTGQRSCHIRYRYSFSKNWLLQTGLLQGAIVFSTNKSMT
jgi:hypothetical protein